MNYSDKQDYRRTMLYLNGYGIKYKSGSVRHYVYLTVPIEEDTFTMHFKKVEGVPTQMLLMVKNEIPAADKQQGAVNLIGRAFRKSERV